MVGRKMSFLLPEDVIREILLPCLEDREQIQFLDCSSRFRLLKKEVRKIYLSQEKVNRCADDEEYLRKIRSMMVDPGKQLHIQSIRNVVANFPFNETSFIALDLESEGTALLSQFFEDQHGGEIKFKTTTLHVVSSKGFKNSSLQYLEKLCSFGFIQTLTLGQANSSSSIPYFSNVKKLCLINIRNGIALPILYTSHLWKLDLYDCANIDVRCLGHIPELSLLHCKRVKGASHLINNRRIEIGYCKFYETATFSNLEQLNVYESDLSIDLSKCSRLRILQLYHSHNGSYSLKLIRKNLPLTVRRCRIGDLCMKAIDWKMFLSQLVELSLSYDDDLLTLAGLGFDQIPVLELRYMRALHSITGLGGRNRKVSLRFCNSIRDFSPLQAVDTVIIENCSGFQDVRQVKEVRELQLLGYEGRLHHLYNLEKKTQVLRLGGRVRNSYDFSEIIKIPQLILTANYYSGGYFLEEFENFLSSGGRLHNEVITFYTRTPLKHLYDTYLTAYYHYDDFCDHDIHRKTLIRKQSLLSQSFLGDGDEEVLNTFGCILV